jgi:cellulose synthase operon protein C
MVLAQIQTSLEQYPAAIESSGKAIAVRPDRVDLRLARAGLEERLMRFDDAAADYERIYQLAFKNPKWMEKVAEVRVRQGRADDVVAALKIALIDVGPDNAGKYFEVARRLETWGLLTQARNFAEQGIKAAGPDLLITVEQQSGARTYTRIMTRLRLQEKAYATLQSALADASAVLPVIKEQVARQGIAAITDKEWRDRAQENRVRASREGMRSALNEMGTAVSTYFTPEEKVAFARFAESRRASMASADVDAFAVPLAQSAGLAELEARWRYELMMDKSANSFVLLARMQPFVELQRRRLKFAELGAQLEQFAPRIEPQQRYVVWVAAQTAYQSAGDPEGELRAFAGMPYGTGGREQQMRLFQLLLARKPTELVQRASNWNSTGQDAADYLVTNGNAAQAHALVSSRGRTRTPVWANAYNALVGLYFAEKTPEVNNAFLSALGDDTVAERLAKPVDRAQQLAGNIWFYYGSRYGEYAGVSRQGNPEDFLPATLEESPGSASSYLTVADYYFDGGDTARAIADYEHTLELASGRADVHDSLALAYYKQGARAEAVSQWKQVFSTLGQQVNSMRVPESFWGDFSRTCEHLHSRKLFNEFKPDVDTLLRAYLRRNGNYRSNALLHSAYVAIADPAVATDWLLDLTWAADDPTTVLADVVETSWIPPAQRAPIFQRILQAKQDALSKAEGLQKEGAQQALRSWQVRWIKYLVATKQYPVAGDAIAALSTESRAVEAAAIVPLELQVAAQMGTLDSKIESYRANPQATPSLEVLRAAARQLSEAGDKQSARRVLEFVFAREIENHNLDALNFIGLAEIRIAVGDTSGAVELLRRLVVVVGKPFENLDPAAALLEKTGHNVEAIEFLEQLVKVSPWEPAYRLRLAKANIAASRDAASAQNTLATLASGPDVPYSVRTEAALALAAMRRPVDLGSAELNLLAGGSGAISAPVADQTFFYDVRVSAAQSSADARVKVRLLGNALAETPARDDARIPLFQAAAGMQSDEFARGVIEPLLRQQFFRPVSLPVNREGEIASETNSGPDDANLPGPLKLPTAEQAQVARALGDLMIRLNRLDEALRYLQVARKLERATPLRKEISSTIADVSARLRRQRLNAARQPILHEALEQDRLVRPRLLARSAPSASEAVKGGSRK